VLDRAGITHQAALGERGLTIVQVERVWVEACVPYANYRGTILDGQAFPESPTSSRETSRGSTRSPRADVRPALEVRVVVMGAP
jgi:hypothetical protein